MAEWDMELKMLATTTIDTDVLSRDRTVLDKIAMEELKTSIIRHGVRMPIEVVALEEPEGEKVWGLISGYRRLHALRELHEYSELPRYAEVPALVRPREGQAEAIRAMVAENALRAGLSAWERGQVAVAARDAGAYPTVEAAVEGLYGTANPVKRTRLRALARLVEELAGVLPAPERLSERRALLLADAVHAGHAPRLRTELAGVTAARQWPELARVLNDIARAEADEDLVPRLGGGRNAQSRGERPGLKLRREALIRGCALTVTGPEATETLATGIMGVIRRSSKRHDERNAALNQLIEDD